MSRLGQLSAGADEAGAAAWSGQGAESVLSGRPGLGQPGFHTLRPTFCSRFAMRETPTRAIQKLAGHKNLSTTQRYMHLSPAALEGAIRLLDEPPPRYGTGEIAETGIS